MNATKLVEEGYTYYICDCCLEDHTTLAKANACCIPRPEPLPDSCFMEEKKKINKTPLPARESFPQPDRRKYGTLMRPSKSYAT